MTEMLPRPAAKTLGGLLEERAKSHPGRPALTYREETLDFAEVRRRALDCAKALHAQGVRAGDKVGVLMGNRIEWVVSNFAIQYLGATLVAMNTWYTQRELAYVLEHADIKLLLAADSLLKYDYASMLDALQPFSVTCPKLRTVVMLGKRRCGGAVDYERFLASGAGVADEEILAIERRIDPEEPAYLLYTSGSTSHPKGVLLVHRHLVENMYDIGVRMHFTPDDVVFMPLSLFWGMGCMNFLIGPWAHGAHIVLQEHFDPLEALNLIQRYRCTVFPGTPNIVHAVFEHPEANRFDLSSVRKGTPIGSPPMTLKLLQTVMPLGIRCFGLTETHGFSNMHDASDPIDKRSRTEGRIMPGFQMCIVDPETGEALGPGKSGEIRLRGRIMKAYYKNPDATAAAFDEDGWFRTGDIGQIDDEGYLLFMGRYKEMLKTGGINVAPIEIEEVLLKHPAVQEAFVCGLPDPVRDQIVAAVIVLSSGMRVTEEELARHCREQLAAYKVPRRMRFATMDELPQTASRKVHRLRLQTLFQPEPTE
ncbi:MULTISPECIES: class I adenylate-forming enzyme family protein [Cupriavidus]|uniref:Fatty-acyl-CoA synthase n=2 Tax=Cupriavidus TaxID=106589 RepID=A0A7W4VFF5_9BURK|nr:MULTISPECIES: class I adenylate-forming enzyme family protein [Cupriavidus]MBB3009895.1 fatty-acyl-CoA synthase [Cupriavidus alkaliphilus]QBY56229.1 long-chain fatty acid--CoA ligase [Cupriavidus oxalaticus]